MKAKCCTCGKEFTLKKWGHQQCKECWIKTAPKCKNCGKIILGHPRNHDFCYDCFNNR